MGLINYIQNQDFFSGTDVGLVRKANEDSCGTAETPNGHLFVVCDGMGGHVGGATASSIAVKSIIEYFVKAVYANPAQALHDALCFANAQIYGTALAQPELKGMGTTACVLLVKDNAVWIAHVGDSRIYLYTGNYFHRITKDHSFVQGLVDQGLITDAEAESHPNKNRILRALGIDEVVKPEVCQQPIIPAKNDIFLICSDGLCGLVHDTTMQMVLSEATSLPEKGNKLITMAKEAGGHDNITVQLIQVTNTTNTVASFVSKSPKENLVTIPPQGIEDSGHSTPRIKKPLNSKLIAGVATLCIVILGAMTYFVAKPEKASSGEEPPIYTHDDGIGYKPTEEEIEDANNAEQPTEERDAPKNVNNLLMDNLYTAKITIYTYKNDGTVTCETNTLEEETNADIASKLDAVMANVSPMQNIVIEITGQTQYDKKTQKQNIKSALIITDASGEKEIIYQPDDAKLPKAIDTKTSPMSYSLVNIAIGNTKDIFTLESTQEWNYIYQYGILDENGELIAMTATGNPQKSKYRMKDECKKQAESQLNKEVEKNLSSDKYTIVYYKHGELTNELGKGLKKEILYSAKYTCVKEVPLPDSVYSKQIEEYIEKHKAGRLKDEMPKREKDNIIEQLKKEAQQNVAKTNKEPTDKIIICSSVSKSECLKSAKEKISELKRDKTITEATTFFERNGISITFDKIPFSGQYQRADFKYPIK